MPARQPGTSPACGRSRHCFLNTASGRQVLADFGFEIKFSADAHILNLAVERFGGRKIGSPQTLKSEPSNAGERDLINRDIDVMHDAQRTVNQQPLQMSPIK